MKVLFLIPARGGSKGLPGKNKILFGGKPLLAWSIEAAQNSMVKGDVIVSTDDEEIAALAKEFGAEIPFMRPKHLSTDDASAMHVIFHVLDEQEKRGFQYDVVVLLQPTSPLRSSADIQNGISLISDHIDAVVGVSVCEHHPFWTNTLPENNMMGSFLRDEVKDKQRQQLPVYYQINGALYIGKVDYIRENKVFPGEKTKAYIMPAERSVDIDTEKDLALALYYLNKK
jgi:CMP-N,N'-diacetyllegionaminic acid synthase